MFMQFAYANQMNKMMATTTMTMMTKFTLCYWCMVIVCCLLTTLATAEQLKSCTSKPYIDMDRIFGGSDAAPMEFPHQISLQIHYLDSHVCGGTLIGEQWVLTAAHCFSRSRYPFHWQVKLGEHSLSKKDTTEKVVTVSKVLIHERYNNRNQLNDVALIKLDRPLDLTGTERHLKPVCLADSSFTIRTGHQCVVTGWGRGEKGQRVTDILQKLYQPLLDSRQCAKAWEGIGWPITENHVCVGDLVSQNGVCSGDSGGPVQCRLANGAWMQVGITSWTTSVCTAKGYAAVFTRVASYRDWIQDKMNNY